ncbi:Bug family tripartite tricarboxylate transporter substrate binding protein [Paralcaligenes ginsengisoli]
MYRTVLRLLIGAFLSSILTGPAFSSTWPDKPVKIVVSQGPGSGSDIMARLLGRYLGHELGQSVIVENHPGASGMIGNAYVANSKSDGYTLLFSSTAPLLVAPLMLPDAKFRYTDLVPVASVMRAQFVVLVANSPGSPKTLSELMSRIRAGSVAYSSAGQGTMTHLASELLLKEAGLTATHVPYKGSGQSLTDLIGGQVLFSTDSLTASMAAIKSGRLRALAVTGPQRSPSLSDVPTLSESGFPGLTVTTIGGLFGPKGVPAELIDRLHAAVSKALQNHELMDSFAKLDTEVLNISNHEFAEDFQKDAVSWDKLLTQIHLKRSE